MRRGVGSFPWTAAIVIATMACSSTPPLQSAVGEDGWGPSEEVVDASNKRPSAPRALPIPEDQRKRWEGADTLAEMELVPGRFQSEHLNGDFDRTVVVNDAAAGYLALSPTTPFAAGAMVVQRHHPRGSDRVVTYFVMEKLAPKANPAARDWRFTVLDEQRRIANRPNLALCARCHADAPFNGLFGQPIDDFDDP